jgi:hypothetical protein
MKQAQLIDSVNHDRWMEWACKRVRHIDNREALEAIAKAADERAKQLRPRTR